jgi:2,4-dienoyl-CoA reductase-like NADH-dependent reductase (Old Yellow Enzyme family)
MSETQAELTTRSVDALFEAVAFGGATARNRIVMAPMTRSRSPGHVPNDRVVEYYRRRAAGGVGLIITEGTTVDHPAASGYPDVPAFHGDEALLGWKRVVDAVHAEGALIAPQLWHVGSIRQTGMQPDPEVPGYAPSAVVHPFLVGRGGQTPVAMTQRDIDDVVAAFGSAAGHAQQVGFDGLELHGAHGYLIDQFFWSATNQRTDGYGGDFVDRTRFAVETIAAARAAVGPDFPICLRFSQWKMGDYRHKLAASPEELERFLAPLVDAGVDIFHCSTRRFFHSEFEGSDLNLAGWTKKLTGKPTMTVGSVGLDSDFLRSYAGKEARRVGLDQLFERLDEHEFDFVAVGRALLADAEWPNKLRSGRENDIVAFTPEHMRRFE